MPCTLFRDYQFILADFFTIHSSAGSPGSKRPMSSLLSATSTLPVTRETHPKQAEPAPGKTRKLLNNMSYRKSAPNCCRTHNLTRLQRSLNVATRFLAPLVFKGLRHSVSCGRRISPPDGSLLPGAPALTRSLSCRVRDSPGCGGSRSPTNPAACSPLRGRCPRKSAGWLRTLLTETYHP